MKIKMAVIAFVTITAGVFSFTRTKNAPPSDLRDAVADNRGFDISIPAFDKGNGNLPVPKIAVAHEKTPATTNSEVKLILGNKMKRENEMSEPATKRTDVIAQFEELGYGVFLTLPLKTWPVFTNHQELFDNPLPRISGYRPTKLNVDQWISVLKKADVRYAVLNAKEGFGFTMWHSKYTDYGVSASSNSTDVVAEFVKACRKYGIVPGLHYCLGADMYRRYKGMTDDQYYEYANNQITELLTNYGPIATMWLSGLGAEYVPARVQQAYDTIKSLQPDCVVVTHSPRPEYSRKIEVWPTDVFQPGRHLPPPAGHNPLMEHNGKTYYLPMDILSFTTRYPLSHKEVLPIKEILKRYQDITSRGAKMTLMVTTDPDGTLSEEQIQRLMELAEAIK